MKSSIPVIVVCAVLGLAVLAPADVEVDVQSADKVQGSISGPDTVDVYRIPCPAGATLKVKAKGKKGLRPSVDVEAPGAGGDPQKAVKLTDGPLEEGGVYTVRVSGTGATQGDYALSIAFALPKKTTRTVELGEGETELGFAAIAGTVLKVKAKAAKGSAAVPRILRVEGPGDFELVVSGPLKSSAGTLGKTELPRDGDYRIVVDDGGTAGGGASDVTIQLKQPKPAKRRIDLRDRTIGNALGERLAVSEVVGGDGGVVGIALPGEGGPESLIAGANVEVPAGALSSPTPIVVATTTDVKPKGDDGGAGPSVFFGPEGLTFAEDVSVTIPMDVEQFEGDFSALRVYTRDGRGKVTLVDGPYEVDADAGTCTFQVSHFSSFRAARAGAGAAAEAFFGAWRLTDNAPGEGDSFLVINENGSVDVVSDVPQVGCFRTRILPPGTQVEQAFRIVDGRLQVVGDDEALEYEPAKARDIPRNCTDFDPGTP